MSLASSVVRDRLDRLEPPVRRLTRQSEADGEHVNVPFTEFVLDVRGIGEISTDVD
jgi:hypothetical protein